MKSVKAYRDCEGDIVYVYNGRLYPFTGAVPNLSIAITVKNYPNSFLSHGLHNEYLMGIIFPSGIEAAYVTEFQFEEEN